MIELDVDNRVIYFATGDNKIYRRPVDLPIENGAKELIKDAPGIISGKYLIMKTQSCAISV
jgi:hypothetical protein